MRKISIIADGQFADKQEDKDLVLSRFSFVKELGAEINLVTDEKFTVLPEGCPYKSAKHRIEFEGPTVFDYDPAFLKSLEGSEAIIVHYSAVNKKMLDAVKNLKFIGVLRSGVENVEIEAANARNIAVSCSPGRVSEPVADYTVTLICAFNRNVSQHDMAHKGKWEQDKSFVPPLMSELTVGIVGFGIIGKKVAKRLAGFGCRLIAYDPFMNEEAAKQLGVEPVSLEELMKQSDCVTVHARYTEETANLISRQNIALMKPSAFIVNTARSRLIDEEALVEALKNHKIRGAALDVYNSEPLPDDSPFFQMDNVLLSPHIAGTSGNWTRMTCAAMETELRNYLEGKKLQYQVNK
ncbi:MAG: 2-hydroxyacid dehydrogenase [Erysipelotrichia bacterium]|nr:2-hydroxyacid dehydrogenase [Erysipelotrichia bacterium]